MLVFDLQYSTTTKSAVVEAPRKRKKRLFEYQSDDMIMYNDTLVNCNFYLSS